MKRPIREIARIANKSASSASRHNVSSPPVEIAATIFHGQPRKFAAPVRGSGSHSTWEGQSDRNDVSAILRWGRCESQTRAPTLPSPERQTPRHAARPRAPAQHGWGDADRRTLYLAAETGIYRIRLNIAGAGALPKPAAMAKN